MHLFIYYFFLVRRLSKKNAQCGQSSWLIRREACLHLLKACCWCLCFWPLNRRLVHQVRSETSLSEIHKKLNCMSESHMNLLFCFAFCSPRAFDAYTRSVSEAAGKHLWFVCNIIRLAYTWGHSTTMPKHACSSLIGSTWSLDDFNLCPPDIQRYLSCLIFSLFGPLRRSLGVCLALDLFVLLLSRLGFNELQLRWHHGV